ncbi:uncharacterized protein LOC144467670 [Augochlora pura]
MDPRALLFVVIFISFSIFINIVITNPIAVPEKTTSNIMKIVRDCRNSDIEIYMACFKREKRNLFLQGLNEYTQEDIQFSNVEIGPLIDTENRTNENLPQQPINLTTQVHIHNHINASSLLPSKPECPCYYFLWEPCYCRNSYPYLNQWPWIPYGGFPPAKPAEPVTTKGSSVNYPSNNCNPGGNY